MEFYIFPQIVVKGEIAKIKYRITIFTISVIHPLINTTGYNFKRNKEKILICTFERHNKSIYFGHYVDKKNKICNLIPHFFNGSVLSFACLFDLG